jgi:hypothetical protein
MVGKGSIMKKTGIILALAFLVAAAWIPALAQGPQASRRVIYALEPGEEILMPESSLCITMDGEHVTLVLAKAKEGPFFVVRDGVKKGPFTKLAESMKVADEGRCDKPLRGSECAMYSPNPEAIDMASILGDQAGGQVIRFNGKIFGPYAMILNVTITADKSRLYYIAVENEKTWFGCTDGRKVQVGGMPEDFKFSPDGRNALIKMTGTLSMSDIQKLIGQAPEKVAAAMKDNDKKFLYAIDGRKFGPFGDDFSDYWFPKTSNVFYYEADGKVYRDGVAVPVPEPFAACAFYPSEDGKKYALFTYENLIFSDGAKYPFPLGLLTRAQDGGTIFKLVALENKKDFVVYQRTL